MAPDHLLLADLKCESNHAFGDLYQRYFSGVSRFVTSHGGTVADAEDLFQDTLLALVTQLRRENFILSAALKTYVLAIAKHLWFKRLRTEQRALTRAAAAGDGTKAYGTIDQALDQERTSADRVHQLLHRITAHCQGLIHAMFFHDKTIDIIQQEYGYATRHTAINQKHKCVEQIRRVKENDEAARRR